MKHSEAVAWIDAMREATITGQIVTLQSYRQHVAHGRDLDDVDGYVIRTTSGHLFDGPDAGGHLGLGNGIVGAMDGLLDRVRDGGTITAMEFYNLCWLFNRDVNLGIHLVSVAHQRGGRPPLTVDGIPTYSLPELDLDWLATHRQGWDEEA